ncbi:uncharacterized protein LOC131954320 isoform X2 [Physella acuta]|uniref:uncharacterized protein LOC131954320 isoform X1 n=1 Tax=Physella acuta TaxID=109671 RepID=UPI0027DDDC2F|nr:uncharacterized protein LOC131954320 isoform X1 [Physella acuta]XP_059173899.1 uncharacterized protein LOC131954320 isoform X2 [Physella acuta]
MVSGCQGSRGLYSPTSYILYVIVFSALALTTWCQPNKMTLEIPARKGSCGIDTKDENLTVRVHVRVKNVEDVLLSMFFFETANQQNQFEQACTVPFYNCGFEIGGNCSCYRDRTASDSFVVLYMHRVYYNQRASRIRVRWLSPNEKDLAKQLRGTLMHSYNIYDQPETKGSVFFNNKKLDLDNNGCLIGNVGQGTNMVTVCCPPTKESCRLQLHYGDIVANSNDACLRQGNLSVAGMSSMIFSVGFTLCTVYTRVYNCSFLAEVHYESVFTRRNNVMIITAMMSLTGMFLGVLIWRHCSQFIKDKIIASYGGGHKRDDSILSVF